MEERRLHASVKNINRQRLSQLQISYIGQKNARLDATERYSVFRSCHRIQSTARVLQKETHRTDF